jgi:hypothetical protein
MKIVDQGDKKLAVFEEGIDDELKANFMAIVEEEDKLVAEAKQAAKTFEEALELFVIAKDTLDLHRRRTHRKFWGPINEAMAKTTEDGKAPGMSFNRETREISIKEKQEEPTENKPGVSMHALEIPPGHPLASLLSKLTPGS